MAVGVRVDTANGVLVGVGVAVGTQVGVVVAVGVGNGAAVGNCSITACILVSIVASMSGVGSD